MRYRKINFAFKSPSTTRTEAYFVDFTLVEPTTLFLLFAVALCAGWVDSIAGGGGLLTTPALLWAGVTPISALATNKAQSVFGTGSAAINYARHGLIDFKQLYFAIAMTFTGSMAGAYAVNQFDNAVLMRVVPFLLVAFALYFLFSPKVSDIERHKRISMNLFALTAGFGIGFYDGFFGPGTGSFFTLAFVTLLGFGISRATAHAKVLNFTSNLAALLYFISAGLIIWEIAIIMALGQIIGSVIGSNMAVKNGVRLIKPLLVSISIIMAIKLFLEAH